MDTQLKERLFFDPATAKPKSADHPNRRNVRGDGGTMLRVPGLKHLSAIGVLAPKGEVAFPLKEVRRHLMSAGEEPERESVTYDLFSLRDEGTLEARILRAVISNDGVFQDATTFWVEGDWDTKIEDEARVLAEANVAKQTAEEISERSNIPRAPKGRRR